ncbi:rhomboid family intramembrane serine protease [Nocardia cyriacigeorgica]|uniref:rhomboid family intramembrane serine protease n=1 Tax=Nocardia cyriacigeorgica TaxID=135487 RepID=UPI001894692F|nr:rhomboid family intramembrane serine protease [Nocardia cyriacigeorgica]MBF6095890.1 rhomboid family intramembrane serine protease [Nocardia cyriacigeorgica]MBF6399721.1 rhomboid family intramembrane serine protease [Nocardia cyriacigeorgica]MBF6405351.1 rhomboid family intramembrane serine protease [Nocardia cyriacigeorgica]MBF6499523.1 rhomboid family intramembrane serine protease [Nocardia cyriacigeorgica]
MSGAASPWPGSPTPPNGRSTLLAVWAQAAVIVLGFTASLYVIEGFDAVAGVDLDQAGIEPRQIDGLTGILYAPVLHGGWAHLIGNTLPVLVLGFLALVSGIARGLAATAIIWVVAGVGTWLTGGSGTVHLGASALVFGWLTFIILRGWFGRHVGQIIIGLIVLAVYGSLLWGVLPGQPGISWQGHLFGAVGGVLAAWMLSGDERKRQPAVPPGAGGPMGLR